MHTTFGDPINEAYANLLTLLLSTYMFQLNCLNHVIVDVWKVRSVSSYVTVVSHDAQILLARLEAEGVMFFNEILQRGQLD